MATETKQVMLSINDVVEIAKLFNRDRIGSLVDPGVLADCDGRCGCVGGNCECRGGVSSRFDRSWVEVMSDRQSRINELRQQLSMLEEKG